MVLLSILGFVIIINSIYYFLFSKFAFSKVVDKAITTLSSNNSEVPGVTLIVCAKNEGENLYRNIPLWLEQDHPNFELLLINDASIDNSLEIMEGFAEKDPRIQIVNVENNEAFWASKKYALTLGIKRTKNNRILFTDADCRPATKQWLRVMASSFSEEKQLVLGYGGYEKAKGLLNRLVRYETLMSAMQYFSYAKAGIPYMGVGRNLGYTSDLYYGNNGFMSHMKIPYGDDDLFVNEVATKSNTIICDHESAFTYSIPKKRWKDWFIQKKRHFGAAKLYKSKHKFLLSVYYIFNLLFWPLSISCLLLLDWKIPVSMIAFRFLIQYVVTAKTATRLKENDLIPLIPFLDLFLIFIQMSTFISNSYSKPNRWQ